MTLGVNALCGGGAIANGAVGSRIFVGLPGKILSSDDGGASWQERFNSGNGVIYGFARKPSNGVVLACGVISTGQDCLIKSTDGGATWANAGNVLGGAQHAYSICYAEDIDTWFIGGNGGTLRRSTDDGNTWLPCTIGFGGNLVNRVRHFPHANLLAVCGNNGRLTYSTDGGLTFSPTIILVTSALGGVAYSPALGVYAICTYNSRAYTSPDFITWTQRASFSGQGNNIEYHHGSNAFYVATGVGARGVTRNLNILGGGTWGSVFSSGTADVNNIIDSEGIGGLLIARTSSPHVYSSSDGATFNALAAVGATGAATALL